MSTQSAVNDGSQQNDSDDIENSNVDFDSTYTMYSLQFIFGNEQFQPVCDMTLQVRIPCIVCVFEYPICYFYVLMCSSRCPSSFLPLSIYCALRNARN